MKNRTINWIVASVLMLPLTFIIYTILQDNPDKALGITGVLFLFCFNQFFFQRKNYSCNLLTITLFYIVGILGAILVAYSQAYWLILFWIYAFYIIFSFSTVATNDGKVVAAKIENEIHNRKWYQRIWATQTQQSENKNFLTDFFYFSIFLIIVLIIYNTWRLNGQL